MDCLLFPFDKPSGCQLLRIVEIGVRVLNSMSRCALFRAANYPVAAPPLFKRFGHHKWWQLRLTCGATTETSACGEKPHMEEFKMQGIKTRDVEIAQLFETASKIASRYGRIGLSEPEDIVQKTMIKVLDKNDGRKPSVAWMRAVLRNIARDEMRSATRDFKNMISESDNDEEHGSILECDFASSYKAEPVEFDLMPKLKEMLAKLSLPLQRVLVLHVEGYSYEEIAAMTKVNIGTVRSRLFYARRKARHLLRDMQ